MFKIRKSGDKTSSGEIGLDIRTHASPKVGQDQVSGGVASSVGMPHPLHMFNGNLAQLGKKSNFGNKVQITQYNQSYNQTIVCIPSLLFWYYFDNFCEV